MIDRPRRCLVARLKKSFQCLRDVVRLNPPEEAFRLKNDGKKWKHNARQRKDLLLQLATWANPDGTDCRPAVEKLAEPLRWDKRTVYRFMAQLRALGFVFDAGLHRPTGIRNWTIDIIAIAKAATDSRLSVTLLSALPVTDTTVAVTDTTPPVTDSRLSSPLPSIEHRPSKRIDRKPTAKSFVESGETCLPCSSTTDQSNVPAVEGECQECGDPCPTNREFCEGCVNEALEKAREEASPKYMCSNPCCGATYPWSRWNAIELPDNQPDDGPRLRTCPACEKSVRPEPVAAAELGAQ